MILQDIQLTIELDKLTTNSYQDIMDILQAVSVEDVRSAVDTYNSIDENLTPEQEQFVVRLTI